MEECSRQRLPFVLKINTLLISDEPPHILQYKKKFTDQFANIISCHEYIQHKNNILYQQGLPWHIGRKQSNHKNISFSLNYDELASIKQPKKKKLLSVICSNKSFMPEYQKRIEFIEKLKEHFGDKVDLFGRGIKEVADKWDALAPLFKTNTILRWKIRPIKITGQKNYRMLFFLFVILYITAVLILKNILIKKCYHKLILKIQTKLF